ncbi:macrophage metalloelastase-like [Haliotis rubra]|uniref:macrophage metalloelastase-like n=1 Tax=Haliotis rubra TaxID=36100 RepID=UPI001EE5CEFC|nr:macrophage metalloelastase-like [Haliotis rubra]
MKGSMKCLCLLVTCFVITVQGLASERDKRSRRRPINLVHDFDVEGFLKDFGYMDNIPAGIVGDELRSVFDRDLQIKDAVKDFQYFYGLKETGEVDHKTMRMMKLPRCGVPDKERNDDIRKKRSAFRYTHLGSKWSNPRLTWKLTKPTYKLRTDDQKRTIREAFKIWENVAPLRITETTGNPDMEIFFASGEHGDGRGNAFDGRSRVLAHAFGPGKAKISGDAHFDNDEDWTLKSDHGSDMLVVAAHEFGHSLGLGHSRDQGALMFPAYRGQDALTLGQDDIRAIQILYGSRPGYTVNPRRTRPTPATRSPPRTRFPPRTRAPYRPPTTPTPTTTTTPSPPCTVDFDSVVAGPERFYYAFKEGSVFKFNDGGMEEGYPKRVHEVFQGAPAEIDIAFSVARTSKIYLIKDKQVWRYTDLTLDEGFPFEFRRDHFPEAPRFTMSLIDDRGKARVIMFGTTKWWFYNFDTVQSSRPLPYQISTNWRGVPRDVQYSVRWTDNNYYLITSNGHVIFDHNRRVASRRGLVSGIPPWMENTCNAIMASPSASGHLGPLALITIITMATSQLLMR